MRLSDVMSAMQLSQFAEVALVLFMLAFAAVACQLLRRGRASEWEAARQMPLRDEGGADPDASPVTEMMKR